MNNKIDRKASAKNPSIRQAVLLIILLWCMSVCSGCYYYKSIGYQRIANKPKKFCRDLRSSLDPSKYVIVHQGNDMWHLSDMVIDMPDRNRCSPADTMYGYIEEVDSLCAFYYYKYREKDRRAVRYFIDDDDHVTSQVHVYVEDSNLFHTAYPSIPVSAIKRIEVYKQATFRSQWPWITARIGLEILLFCVSPHGHSHTHSSTPRNTTHTPNVSHGPRSK